MTAHFMQSCENTCLFRMGKQLSREGSKVGTDVSGCFGKVEKLNRIRIFKSYSTFETEIFQVVDIRIGIVYRDTFLIT